jgi:hypothetical protein
LRTMQSEPGRRLRFNTTTQHKDRKIPEWQYMPKMLA